MSTQNHQLLLWDTKVVRTGDGSAQVVASKPVLHGGVDEARDALGGKSVVSKKDVYRLVREKFIQGWKLRAGVERSDGKASNCKLVVDLRSCLEHVERMKADQVAARKREKLSNGELF